MKNELTDGAAASLNFSGLKLDLSQVIQRVKDLKVSVPEP
jgi:hypothetical protein